MRSFFWYDRSFGPIFRIAHDYGSKLSTVLHDLAKLLHEDLTQEELGNGGISALWFDVQMERKLMPLLHSFIPNCSSGGKQTHVEHTLFSPGRPLQNQTRQYGNTTLMVMSDATGCLAELVLLLLNLEVMLKKCELDLVSVWRR